VLTTKVDTVWASFWGLFYRKFFWDFVGGIVRNPGGLQCVNPAIFVYFIWLIAYSCDRPSPNAAIFITLIVKAPVIQILTMLTAFFMIALEFPMPQLKGTVIHRSIVLRIVMLVMQAFMAILFYQVSNQPC
jgi:sulfate adenylyltransferase (ADP) / ATP adenylyltransferase